MMKGFLTAAALAAFFMPGMALAADTSECVYVGSKCFHGTILVDPTTGLPSAPNGSPSNPAVTGAFTAVGQSAPFTPVSGRDFDVSGYGTFSGSLQLERSFDGGTTWLPLTAAGTQLYKWTGPFSETASEPKTGVLYRLNCTAYTSGTINYRMEQ